MLRASVLRSFTHAPWPGLFALAAAGLMLSAFRAGHATLPAFCGGGTVQALRDLGWADALGLALALNPPGRLLGDWAVMLLAMMPPLLAAPLMHVWRSSLPQRRPRSAMVFVLGYGLLWMLAGPILIGLALLLQFAGGQGAVACLAALLLAILWSASPWQRIALNRGHRLRRIGLFGWAADRDCLTFGAMHGLCCIASCWAWMLAALTAGPWHMTAMVLAGLVMLRERLALPERPRWRLPTLLSPLVHWPILGTILGPILGLQRGEVRHG